MPSAGREAYGLVLLKSPEVLRIIEGLGYSGANIQVIDAQRRVRAEIGSYESTPKQAESFLSRQNWYNLISYALDPLYNLIEANLRASPLTDDEVIKSSLSGLPAYQRRYSQEEGEVILRLIRLSPRAK